MAGGYKQLVQYGRGRPIKAGQLEPSSHLETTIEIHHIYEDLNVLISQTRRSQQLEILLSLNSKQAACFSSFRQLLHKRGFFTRRGDFNAHKDPIVRLIFSKHNDFSLHFIF
jgi:hypothetical protein